MRLTFTIFSAASSFVLVVALGLYARSYFRFDGVLHYEKDGKPGLAIATDGRLIGQKEFRGRSTGVISYRGQLTYVSITNPIPVAQDWESWAVPADAEYSAGPMNIVWDVRKVGGLGYGSAKTQSALVDPVHRVAWQLPFQYATAPHWVLAAPFAVLPYLWVARYRRAQGRRRAGRCARCGKDLRGVTGTCPGCGAGVE